MNNEADTSGRNDDLVSLMPGVSQDIRDLIALIEEYATLGGWKLHTAAYYLAKNSDLVERLMQGRVTPIHMRRLYLKVRSQIEYQRQLKREGIQGKNA